MSPGDSECPQSNQDLSKDDSDSAPKREWQISRDLSSSECC